MNRAPAWRRPEVVLLLAASLLLLPGLGGADLWAPDEPRYAQVAEEMRSLRHGASGLVVLHLNDEVYTQKPPAYFWLAAATGAPLGRVTEGAARLPSALAGIALVLLTFVFGRRLLGARVALLGAALLLTTFEFAWVARRVQLDVLLALLETLALFAFWRLDRGIGSRRLTLAWMHAALGLAVLTKGPVGFLVPLLVVGVTLAVQGRLRTLPGLLPPWALLLSLGPALLWLGAVVVIAPPGYLDEAVGTNVFGRFFAGTSHARPFYYYFYQLPVDLLPWTLLLPAVYVAGRQVFSGAGGPEREAAVSAWTFLLAWVGASFLFFSLSGGKRGLYLLPAFPAFALLCADGWLRGLGDEGKLSRPLAWGLAVLAALLLAVGVAGLLAPLLPVEELVSGRLVAAGVSALVITGVALVAWHRAHSRESRVWIPLAAVFAAELAIFVLALPALDPSKSPRPVALAAVEVAGPDGQVGLLGQRAMVGGLVYYGGRPVTQLSTPQDVADFLRDGGDAVVLREKHLDWVRGAVAVNVERRLREGRRAKVVVSAGEDPAHSGDEQDPTRRQAP